MIDLTRPGCLDAGQTSGESATNLTKRRAGNIEETNPTDGELEALWRQLMTQVLIVDEYAIGEEVHVSANRATLQDIGQYFQHYHSKGVPYLNAVFSKLNH